MEEFLHIDTSLSNNTEQETGPCPLFCGRCRPGTTPTDKKYTRPPTRTHPQDGIESEVQPDGALRDDFFMYCWGWSDPKSLLLRGNSAEAPLECSAPDRSGTGQEAGLVRETGNEHLVYRSPCPFPAMPIAKASGAYLAHPTWPYPRYSRSHRTNCPTSLPSLGPFVSCLFVAASFIS